MPASTLREQPAGRPALAARARLFAGAHTLALSSLALLALALGLRLYRLDAQSLWLDEGSTWAEVTGRSGKGWLALLGELFSPTAGYPLYHLLLKAWVALAGDAAWALRFPSALAGAAAVVAVYLAAVELAGRPGWRAALPALLVALAPFALWHSQDAKVYALLTLVAALLLWRLLRALRSGARSDWAWLAGVALASLFVHRLALLALAGALLAVALAPGAARADQNRRRARLITGMLAGALAAVGVAGTILAARNERPGARASVGPLEGLGLTFSRFSLDQWPGDLDGYLGLPAALWLLPFAGLAAWGLWRLARDARRGEPGAVAVLCLLLAPLGLFALTHALAPIYEPRYLVPAFPAWALALGYPWLRPAPQPGRAPLARAALLAAALLVTLLSLLQPGRGLWSGDPVKEQWREAVALLAARAHPDDLLLLHPYYVRPMYDYYAPRLTPDPLPAAYTFPIFAEGDTCGIADPTPAQIQECSRRRYEPFFNEVAHGRKRALLLVAPDHARTVDPPPAAGDRLGWVGLRFEFSSENRAWPCGGAELVGVLLMCQSYPETFSADGPGAVPEPATPADALFGDALRLRGVTIAPHGGALRPGGALPVALYWEAAAPPAHDYRVFLHLCRDCEQPPLANDDGPPLFGYPPAGMTSTWRVGDPVHDERAVALPASLPPGRYTLLLGVYHGAGAVEDRLPITGAAPSLPGGRLVLGEVEVTR